MYIKDLDRCCGNCNWSFTEEDYEKQKEENDIYEDDLNLIEVGTCCLNIDHLGKYVCYNHEYREDIKENKKKRILKK